MPLFDAMQGWQVLLLGGIALVLGGVVVARFVHTMRRFKTLTGGEDAGIQSSSALPQNAYVPMEVFDTDFAAFLQPLVLKDEAYPPTNEKMIETLLDYRFPFTPVNLDPVFPDMVKATLAPFPPILIQLLYQKRLSIELDVVCDIPAMMDPDASKLMLSRFFVMDSTLFPIESNPVFPYGLSTIVLHELGHFLDWFLPTPNGEARLSATATFLQAFASDCQAVPEALAQPYDTCAAWREEYGGYLKLPPDKRYQSDLSMFMNQEEEVFGDAFAYLMTGQARDVVLSHFPNAIKAVETLMRDSIQTVSKDPREAPS